MADLALADQPGHRADRLLDGYRGVEAVQVIEIDGLDAEAPERTLAGAPRVGGAAVAAGDRSVRGDSEAELRGDLPALASAGERPGDEFLIGVRTVDLGRVEEVDAELEREVERRQRLAGVARGGAAIGPGHAHAAQAERRDREAC